MSRSDDNYAPTELTAKRAASIWRKLLADPVYDNLGDGPASPEDRFNTGMANAMISMLPNNATNELLDAFETKLAKELLNETRDPYIRTSLSVDYHPCEILQFCADRVGLNMQFPWKTSMNVHGDHLSVRAGYGAPSMFHYPLPDGRWLVTTLHGSDISKVIDLVQGGTPEFTVED